MVPVTPFLASIASPSVLPEQRMVLRRIVILHPPFRLNPLSCPLVNQESSTSSVPGVVISTVSVGSPEGSGPPVLSTCVHLMVTDVALSQMSPPQEPGSLVSELISIVLSLDPIRLSTPSTLIRELFFTVICAPGCADRVSPLLPWRLPVMV